jgi:hypothetical protein
LTAINRKEWNDRGKENENNNNKKSYRKDYSMEKRVEE